jgi:tetratricopeptide (TPR) repeat protein
MNAAGTSSDLPSSKFRAWLTAIAICCATWFAYWPALHGSFLWDDNANVTKPELRPWSGLARIWTDPSATEQYYPLLHSLYWVEHRVWEDDPFYYHLITLFFHTAAAVLFALVLKRLAIPGAWLAGAMFSLHPVCVESVAWISEQKNTLSTLLYLAAALGYLRYTVDRRKLSYGVATAVFVLALLSKSVTATLPAALLVVLWWKQGSLSWRTDVRPLLAWFALGIAVGLFGAWVERHYIGAEGADFILTPAQRVLVAGRVVWFYLGKLLWPANLIFIYPRWQLDATDVSAYLFPLAAAALVVACWAIRRRSRAPLAAILFFIGSLFPVLGFLNVYAFLFSFVTDHWQYLPSLSIIALGSAGIATLLAQVPQPMSRLIFVTTLGLLAVFWTLTWRQCANYRGPLIFYQAILEKNPASWMAHNNLGLELAQKSQGEKALAHYEEALRLRPNYAKAHFNLGNLLAETGRTTEAIVHYETAARLDPRDAEIHNNLGNALGSANRPAEAIGHFLTALQIEPDNAETHGNLATALLLSNQIPQALEQYAVAAKLAPRSSHAQRSLANALLQTGNAKEAATAYQHWLQLEPNSFEAHNLLGVSLAQEGHLAEARTQFEEAIRLKPDYASALENLTKLRALQDAAGVR